MNVSVGSGTQATSRTRVYAWAQPWTDDRSGVREALEDPVGVELATAVGAAVDEHVVARAEVHRQVALDRIPLVVGADQLVEGAARPPPGDRAPAAGEKRRGVAAPP